MTEAYNEDRSTSFGDDGDSRELGRGGGSRGLGQNRHGLELGQRGGGLKLRQNGRDLELGQSGGGLKLRQNRCGFELGQRGRQPSQNPFRSYRVNARGFGGAGRYGQSRGTIPRLAIDD